MNDNSRNKPYWASVPNDEIADEILDKVDKYYEYLSLSGRLALYRRAWLYYYRPRSTGGMINAVGQQGELSALSVNHYANLLQHLEVMTTQQRATFEPRATNSDTKSQAQVILATGLLDYYMREKKLERNIDLAVKECLMYGEAFVRALWDATGGQAYGQTPTGAVAYQGDLEYRNYTPFDCIRDYTKQQSGKDDFYILRDFENKYDLAAKFPDLENEILDDSQDVLEACRATIINPIMLEDSPNIPVYTLIHKISPAMPQGRYTVVLDNGTVLLDGPLPYKETHVYRIAPNEEVGTIFGSSVGFDLLPIQESLDILYSTAITNQATFGVQNILVPKGHDLSTSQIAGGLNIMECDFERGKPEALNLTQTPAEIFNFMGMLEKLGETISGVNSVARGNPEASLKSGTALALIQSQAIQFSMGLQRSYSNLVEDLGTGTIKILQDFASVPRIAQIAGKSNRPLMKEFKGEDLNSINRVTVDMGNPLSRTTSGKVNLAEQMLQFNLIDNPDQYIQVVTTGRLEPVIEGKQAELLLIKAENEYLADGKPQTAIVTDQHAQHILEHKTVLANPEFRMNPNSPEMQATLAHIQEHINFLKTTDPALLALIHQQSLAPQGMPGQPPQAGGQPPNASEPMNPLPAVAQEASAVKMPGQPSAPPGADPASAAIINGNKGQ